MKESDNWGNVNEYPQPPNPNEGERGQPEQWPGYGPPPAYPVDRAINRVRKRKWLAGLLAFFIPGIGHMYLGLMFKGIVLMLLVALDITAIVYVSIEAENVLSIVLLSLLLPIIYFYNLFDAIQSTDTVNERKAAAATRTQMEWMAQGVKPMMQESMNRGVPPMGIVLLAGAGIFILFLAGTNVTSWFFNSSGSIFGAVVLIGAGVGLWFWETRGQGRKGN